MVASAFERNETIVNIKTIGTRIARLTLASAAIVLLSPQAAMSAPPVPTTTIIDFAAGEVCSFPVHIVAVGTANFRRQLPNGVQIFTGPLTATVTNVTTNASRTYNVSGPVFYDPQTNQIVEQGSNLISAIPTSGGPFLIVTDGRVGFPLNEPINQPLRGHIAHDVCAELA
jgi:hypothetical protein